jgi:hypothetical protein
VVRAQNVKILQAIIQLNARYGGGARACQRQTLVEMTATTVRLPFGYYDQVEVYVSITPVIEAIV